MLQVDATFECVYDPAFVSLRLPCFEVSKDDWKYLSSKALLLVDYRHHSQNFKSKSVICQHKFQSSMTVKLTVQASHKTSSSYAVLY